MGMLINGGWTNEDRYIENGAFVRPPSAYHQDIPPELVDALSAEPGRFHLIASLSCPWSHRTLIVRRLKELTETVPLQVAGGPRIEGYAVNGGEPWEVPGIGGTIVHVHQLYTVSDPTFTGRTSVPLLWDEQFRRIVSNESAKIMRAFDAARPLVRGLDFTLVPEQLRCEIEALNGRLHNELSNAVYRAGFAQDQQAYDEAVLEVFTTLDELEDRLSKRRYLFGNVITESDWRLFPTLIRFDAVYHVLFRCARRRLLDYANLWAYARDLHAWKGVAKTVDLPTIREGAYRNDRATNPFGIVAVAPDADWTEPHGRDAYGSAQIALRNGELIAINPVTFASLAQGIA